MTKRTNYNFPEEEIRKEIRKKKGVVNIVLPENASLVEKVKHELAQKIGLTLSQTIEILRGNIAFFALDSLISYVEHLHLPLQVKITSEETKNSLLVLFLVFFQWLLEYTTFFKFNFRFSSNP